MNEFSNLFDDPGDGLPGAPLCECPGVAEVLDAHLNDTEPRLCPKHQQGEINARNAAKAKAKAEDELALAYEVHEGVKARQAKERDERHAAELATAEEAALEQLDPLTRRLTLISGASALPEPVDPRHQVGIGDDAAFTRMLTEMIGGTTDPDDPEGPTAA